MSWALSSRVADIVCKTCIDFDFIVSIIERGPPIQRKQQLDRALFSASFREQNESIHE